MDWQKQIHGTIHPKPTTKQPVTPTKPPTKQPIIGLTKKPTKPPVAKPTKSLLSNNNTMINEMVQEVIKIVRKVVSKSLMQETVFKSCTYPPVKCNEMMKTQGKKKAAPA